MGEAIIYANTHLRTHKNRKYGVDLSQFDDSVMICVQNVCRTETFISLDPILADIISAMPQVEGVVSTRGPE